MAEIVKVKSFPLSDKARAEVAALNAEVSEAENKRQKFLLGIAMGMDIDTANYAFDFRSMSFVERPKKDEKCQDTVK